MIGACSPQRSELSADKIVSTTLCADSYLLAMPELKARYGAFSWQSETTLSTLPSHMYDQYPQAGENREQLIKFRPARFLTGPTPAEIANPDVHLSWGEDFETVWSNFAKISDGFNSTDPTPALKARLDALTQIDRPVRVLYLNRAGGTAGPGTFVHAVFERVGLTNVIETPGWQSPDTETLFGLNPDVIVTSFLNSDYVGTNDRLTFHTALSRKLEETPQIHIPGKFWPCAGPGLIEAAELLSRELQNS